MFLVLLFFLLLILLLQLMMVLWLMMMLMVMHHNTYHCSILRGVTLHFTMMYSFCCCCYFLHLFTGQHRAGDSDCKPRDHEFNPSLVPYYCED